MLKLFNHKQHKILGVDIGATSVKIVEISSSGEKYRVESYGSIALPDNAMEGSTIKDIDAVAFCIRTLLSSKRISTKKAALAVPDSLAISRTIQVHEGMKEDDIEELVMMEADKYIPYPIDEINLDFKVIGTSTKNTAMQDVLIVASRAEHVTNRVEAITRAGLEAAIVDVQSFAIERAAKLLAPDLPSKSENKIVAIIDLGSFYTDFYVMHGMKNIFTREEEFGGVQLIQSIMQHYGMSAEEATKAYYNNALSDDFENEVLQPFKELILLQVKRGLQFFFSSTNYTYVDSILLAGGVAKIPDIAKLLQEHINIPTDIAKPFKHMDFGAKVNQEEIIKESPVLLVACGLALRSETI